MPLEAPAIRQFIGQKCLTSLIPSLFILLHASLGMRQKQDGLGMRQTFSLVCDSELPVSNFCERYRSSASFCAMMTCKDLSLLSKREILACV